MNQPIKIYVGIQPLNLDMPSASEIKTVLFKECPLLPEELPMKNECAPDMPKWHRTCMIEMDKTNSLFRRKKPYSRKLKKAVRQICNIEMKNGRVSVDIHLRQKTKWQRKAYRMVDFENKFVSVPTIKGFKMVIRMERSRL